MLQKKVFQEKYELIYTVAEFCSFECFLIIIVSVTKL